MRDWVQFHQSGEESVRMQPKKGLALHSPVWHAKLHLFPYYLVSYGFRKSRKLIGARYFNKGYGSIVGHLNSSFQTARDIEGHGTHTLSTAAGNFVPGANVFGNGKGTAKGGSPRARVAAYKVCWPAVGVNEGGCYEADILAGFDVAISDGVDVLSVSLGGAIDEYSDDAIAIGSFHAFKKGITVVASAGNSGPGPGSGVSLSQKSLPARKFYPLISGARAKASNQSEEDANLCKPGTLDSEKVKGKILNLAMAFLPTLMYFLLHTSSLQMVKLSFPTSILPKLGTKPAPFMASFSSRGLISLKNQSSSVIAAFTLATGPTDAAYDKRRIPFNTESGTSMSCPHVSGIVGLLKSLHPDWSPAAIRSAIMTTATTRNNNGDPILDSSNTRATPFAYGAGHVQPNRAADPGLVYDLTVNDFLNYLCSRGYTAKDLKLFTDKPYTCPESFSLTDFNYPSISAINLNDTITVTRRVKNVGSPGKYYIHVREPTGVLVSVTPATLEFKKLGEEKTFKVTFKLAPNGSLKIIHLGYCHGPMTSNYAPLKARLVDLFVGLCVIVVDVKLAMELMVFLSFSLA
ncbi:hypothetical protein D5086_022647 [Populus alba]|uniref:Uncharacterized protein n=1 Tax=Populus alba TaxID=43335 RepID=A0ACC4BFQ8_POPAL